MSSTLAAGSSAPWYHSAGSRFVAAIPGHVERLGWDAERLRAHQDRALTELLRTAATRSPFHRDRLGGIDPGSLTVERLPELPVMTKAEMMDRFDDVVTDRRLSRALVEGHLASLDQEPDLLLDRYLVIASGGSSGTRGVFVMTQDDAVEFGASIMRSGIARLLPLLGWPPPFRIPIAFVVAPKAIHATRALSPVSAAMADLTYVPVTLPIDEIAGRLEPAQPMILFGYPSVTAALGDAAAAGRLSIAPKMVITSSEQLTADHVTRIERGFGTPPANSFGSSEGLIGSAPPGSDEFTFASDRCIIEFVDDADRPVPAGTAAHHLLVTNLANHIQPLIRYRLDDVMTELPADPVHGHQRALVSGRNDELVRVGDVVMHPHAVRSALLAHPEVVEYQVTTSNAGTGATLDVAVVLWAPAELDRIGHDVAAVVERSGGRADVSVRAVDQLVRQPDTGKVRRFVTA